MTGPRLRWLRSTTTRSPTTSRAGSSCSALSSPPRCSTAGPRLTARPATGPRLL